MGYKVAIIGCGNIGCYLDKYQPDFVFTHLSAYQQNSEIETIALCDNDFHKAETIAKDKGITEVFADVKEMLEKVKPDIVSICTPDETHYSILKEVVKHSCVKGIWCEKPIAVSVGQAEEMIELCKEKNIKLLVNHIRRYDPFYRSLKEKMESLVGNIQSIVCYYSGGIVTSGSHLIDLLNIFLGECTTASATKTKILSGLNARITYKNGQSISLIPCDNNFYSIMELNILGSKARLDTIDKPFAKYDYRYFTAKEDVKLGTKFISAEIKDISKVLEKEMDRTCFETALADLILSIKNDSSPFSSGEEALKSLIIISALTYSSENNGETINFPFNKKEQIIPKSEGNIKKWKNQQS